MKHYRAHLFVYCVLAVVMLAGGHDFLQNLLVDKRFGWLPREATGKVVLVEIDARSIERVGVWPWPRQLHAEVIGKLDAAGATDIAFDVDFSSASTSAGDLEFMNALRGAGGSIILPMFKQVTHSRSGGAVLHVNRPLPQFSKHSWPAMVNVTPDPDGIARRYSYGDKLEGKFYPSAAALLGGRQRADPGNFMIDFGIQRDSVPRYSFVDVLKGEIGKSSLEGKKVIIGGTAVEFGDRFNVPHYGIITGAMLQVLAAELILQRRTLSVTSVMVTLAGLGFIALVMVLLWGRVSAGYRLALLAGMAIVVEAAAVGLQAAFPVVLNTAAWHALIVIYVGAIALDEIDFRKFMAGIAERRFQRITMSLGDGLMCADRNGLITDWNPAAAAIFGYRPDEIVNRRFEELCTTDDGLGRYVPFSLLELPDAELQAPGGRVMELRGRRKNGQTFPLEACFSGWPGADGFHYGAVLRDISVRKREEERIRYLAAYDTLTGLANRHTLRSYLDAELERAAPGSALALLLVGVDKFKEINDTLGHACGDQVLRAVAEALKGLVKGGSLVGRLSGDEFAIAIVGFDIEKRARELADGVFAAFSKIPTVMGERGLRLACSIGVAIYPTDCDSAEDLLANADLALYRAKGTGRSRCVFFDRTIRLEIEARMSLEAELRQAAERHEFVLFYQPQFNLGTRALVGAEALIRWRHPERGLVSPGEFISALNASAMSDEVAEWILLTACRQGRAWQTMGHELRIGVNLSPSLIQSGGLGVTVGKVLKKTDLPPALLELEVTENILLQHDEVALETFRSLQRLGVQIAFDDFGTGYASLTYLKQFPFNTLKIDRSFVRDLHSDPSDAAIVSAITSLSRQLGLSVIAEGVEDSATADLLARIGCEEGQGYYFGRPMPAEEFERKYLLADGGATHARASTSSAVTAA